MADLIDVIDEHGKHHQITEAHWNRWPSVREAFRRAPATKATPVAEAKTTNVVIEPPTGDKEEEN